MRPDRIVVGETRGEEALDMLQAMNTGHDGSLTTVHANTPRDALSRIETMIAMGATNLPERAMRQQIAAAIQIVIQQSRMSDGTRKVTSISEITGMEGDVITMQEIFLFEKLGVYAGRQGRRPVPRDGRPAEGLRAPEGVGHSPAARHVRRRDGGPLMAASFWSCRRSSSAPAWCSAPTSAVTKLPGILAAAPAELAARKARRGRPTRRKARTRGRSSRTRHGGPLPVLDRFVGGTDARLRARQVDRAVGRQDQRRARCC